MIVDPKNEVVTYTPFDIERMLAGRLSVSSIAMYKRDVRDYQTFCEQQGLDPLLSVTLMAWRDAMVLEASKSPNTINRMISAVKGIIKEAAIRGMIEGSTSAAFHEVPGVQIKAMKSRLKEHSRTRITQEDMRRLCEMPDANTLIGKRDRALLATLASSGLRASELATLTLRQIEKRGRGYALRVRGKTDIDYRDAHLSIEAKGLIDEWIQVRPVLSEYIFTGFSTRAAKPSHEHLSETSVWLIVQKYAKACELEYIKPHDFRRFVGTQLARQDIRKAQKALGHKSIEVTAKHYVLDTLEIGLTDNLY